MKKLFITLILFFCTSLANADGLTLFPSEYSAQAHCQNDIVVWLNLPTGIWHDKGARWYGMTKNGAYVCRQEAIEAGDRGSRNGS